jgi:hypothetical protein
MGSARQNFLRGFGGDDNSEYDTSWLSRESWGTKRRGGKVEASVRGRKEWWCIIYSVPGT